MNIDIKKLENIKEQLDSLKEDEVAFVSEKGKNKYVILPMSLYETFDDVLAMSKSENNVSNVRVVNANDFELSYDEYENVKKQIIEAFDKTFKPKPEKLN